MRVTADTKDFILPWICPARDPARAAAEVWVLRRSLASTASDNNTVAVRQATAVQTGIQRRVAGRPPANPGALGRMLNTAVATLVQKLECKRLMLCAGSRRGDPEAINRTRR